MERLHYAVEMDNKVYEYTHESNMLFCTKIQMGWKYGDLTNKIAVISIELYDKQEYENEKNKEISEIMDVYKGGLE